MCTVHCPKYLATHLHRLWNAARGDPTRPLEVVSAVIDCSDFTADGSSTSTAAGETVLSDTLYRYLVLFGISSDFIDPSSPNKSTLYDGSEVWSAIRDALSLSDTVTSSTQHNFEAALVSTKRSVRLKESTSANNGATRAQSTGRAKQECARQFQADVALWSVATGSHHVMQR
jgi:hypothetical protein